MMRIPRWLLLSTLLDDGFWPARFSARLLGIPPSIPAEEPPRHLGLFFYVWTQVGELARYTATILQDSGEEVSTVALSRRGGMLPMRDRSHGDAEAGSLYSLWERP
jgi:hypothetical protein